mmetsp:Transcript_26198/g.88042  ORF Transcript_26198/g.88042 Transcript_26198/m.88042 type:complete len:253 (-) Transcript_26198:172-930(-)
MMRASTSRAYASRDAGGLLRLCRCLASKDRGERGEAFGRRGACTRTGVDGLTQRASWRQASSLIAFDTFDSSVKNSGTTPSTSAASHSEISRVSLRPFEASTVISNAVSPARLIVTHARNPSSVKCSRKSSTDPCRARCEAFIVGEALKRSLNVFSGLNGGKASSGAGAGEECGEAQCAACGEAYCGDPSAKSWRWRGVLCGGRSCCGGLCPDGGLGPDGCIGLRQGGTRSFCASSPFEMTDRARPRRCAIL